MILSQDKFNALKAERDELAEELAGLRAKVRRIVEDADLFADVHSGDGDELGIAARRLKKDLSEVESGEDLTD